jgi:hypothetical protein
MAARLCTAAQLLAVMLLCLAARGQARDDQKYSEALFIKFLPDGRVSATFDFSTVWSVHPLRFSSAGNGELGFIIDCMILLWTENS